MKKTIIASIALASIALVSWTGIDQTSKADSTYKLDASATTLKWTGKYVSDGHTHTGTVNVTKGTVVYKGTAFSSGNFEIDMNSIVDTDLPADKKGMLEGHLKSPDFFNTASFGTAKVKINSISDQEIKATITVLDKEIPAVMPVKIVKTKKGITATGKFTVDFAALNANGFKAAEGKPQDQHSDSNVSFDLNLVLKK